MSLAGGRCHHSPWLGRGCEVPQPINQPPPLATLSLLTVHPLTPSLWQSVQSACLRRLALKYSERLFLFLEPKIVWIRGRISPRRIIKLWEERSRQQATPGLRGDEINNSPSQYLFEFAGHKYWWQIVHLMELFTLCWPHCSGRSDRWFMMPTLN